MFVALGAVVWAVITLAVGDSDPEDAVEDVAPSPPTAIPTLGATPIPTVGPTAIPAPSATDQPTAIPTPLASPTPRPGPVQFEGVQVNMARANWSTGYLQAEIYRALLQELGYQVNDPSEAEMSPTSFHSALAEDRFDFWVNGWFPHHVELMEEAGLTDIARPIGMQIPSGGLQGFLVDKATAESFGITKLDDIGNSSRIAELFDLDGNGKADLMGCDMSWSCRYVINDTIAANGWQGTMEQATNDHARQFADSVDRHRRGEPILQFVWTPGPYTAQLVPGQDVIWLSVDNPLPSQRGATSLSVDKCPAQPCQTGFTPADIRVLARNDFLEANPAAAKLFELVTIPEADVSQYILEHGGGSQTESQVKAAADRWIAANRDQVDGWLEAARIASGFAPTEVESESLDDTSERNGQVMMAQGYWPTAFVPAAIYRMLLQELGYEVSDPTEAIPLSVTGNLYLDMARGRIDFSASGRFPWDSETIEIYSQVADTPDALVPIGHQTPAGSPNGFVLDKATAQRLQITMLDDIGDDPEIAALFDIDGNGKADLEGCYPNWPCQQLIDDTIVRNGWEDTIDQVEHANRARMEQPIAQSKKDDLTLMFVWGPGTYLTSIVPGEDVIWLSVGDPLPGQEGQVALPESQCPAQPCQLGFAADDIRVVAHKDFLADNPAAAKLLELVTISVEDAFEQGRAFIRGANSKADIEAAATQWIADNRANVDQWLDEARAAT